MPSRRKSSPTRSSRRGTSERSSSEPQSDKRSRSAVSKKKTAKGWRRDMRPRTVLTVVSATKALRWTPALVEAILEELYVDDHFEELLGAPGKLKARQYPQAIAVALILRHSWHPNDLACMLKRLKLRIDDA